MFVPLFLSGFMRVKNVLRCKTDKLLILLALRAKLREIKPSIADHHRQLKRIFDYSLCYDAVRNRLKRLEEQGFLRSEIIRDFVKNDLADSKGVKVKRFTKVYKKVYAINVRNEVFKPPHFSVERAFKEAVQEGAFRGIVQR